MKEEVFKSAAPQIIGVLSAFHDYRDVVLRRDARQANVHPSGADVISKDFVARTALGSPALP